MRSSSMRWPSPAGFGLLFMLLVLGSGRWLYSAMGGTGASLTAALTYSEVVFAGAILVWTFNSLASAIRGTGNMAVPAIVTCAGAVALIPLSPCLIFGWGPFPELGIAGGAVAVVAYYAAGTIVFAAYLWAGRSVVRLSFHHARLRWLLFREILRVGAVAAVITLQTNLTIAIATGLVGRFGPAAIAGYGTGSRLEYSWFRWSSGWAPHSSPWSGPTSARGGVTARCAPRGSAPDWPWASRRSSACGLRRSRTPGCRYSAPIPPCWTPDRAICAWSVRSMACSDLAWPSTSHRWARDGCGGLC